MRLFISYAHVDKYQVSQLVEILRDGGYDPWFDHRLVPGQNFKKQLLDWITACDIFVYAMTPESLTSEWCLWELERAAEMQKPIIPVRMQKNIVLPKQLEDIQYVDFSDGPTPRVLAQLFHGLRVAVTLPPEHVPPAPANPKGTPAQAIDQAVSSMQGGTIIGSQTNIYYGATSDVGALHVTPSLSPQTSLQSALERARTFNGKRNRDWHPFVTTFPDLKIPDMPFCLVPVGTFQMGSNDRDNEKPAHPQTIEHPYWIAQYPVTNAQWAQAVKAGAVPEPLETGDSLIWYKAKKMAAAPVVGVTWFMARDFARWMDCRLPTELEWEYAARGLESLRYPWGDDWNADIPVWRKNSGGKPAVVTSKPEGKSWLDARHMIGNVWEWTSSLYAEYPYQADDGRELDTEYSINVRRVLRGGSWGYRFVSLLCTAYRYGNSPDDRNFSFGGGFRLARS